jgi:hypothetical protein
MDRRAFRPALAESKLEARVSLSRADFNVNGVPTIAFGSAVNRGMFDGLIEKKLNGRWYDAVFFNGHRFSAWAPMKKPIP